MGREGKLAQGSWAEDGPRECDEGRKANSRDRLDRESVGREGNLTQGIGWAERVWGGKES